MSYKSKYFDDDFGWWGQMYDAYPGLTELRPHDKLLMEAHYAYWSKNDRTAYQYIGDLYNEFIRKPSESPLLPPPAHL